LGPTVEKNQNRLAIYCEVVVNDGELVINVPEQYVFTNTMYLASVVDTNSLTHVLENEETKWKKLSNWTHPNCDHCDEPTASDMYCPDCEEYLCKEHIEGHKKGKKTKDHEFVPVEDISLKPVVTKNYYCAECEEEERATNHCAECDEHYCALHTKLHLKSKKTKDHKITIVGSFSGTGTEEKKEDDTPQVKVQSSSINSHKKLSAEELGKIHGKIKLVTSFPDYKVKVVDSFPDLKVKKVDSFPDKSGLWKIVDSFPDYKIQIVDSFPDFTIKYVTAFPGVSKN
jgi:predicted nucleic acid binding AN1-type Zn finger protein